jgi:3-oxoacyl-[acyl-carrier protein] reductase
MSHLGQTALITGASSGVGAATALKLAQLGINVVVNYNSSLSGAQAVVKSVTDQGAQAIAVQGDVSQEKDCWRIVEKTIERFGRLDILINNAGTTTFVPHHDLEGLTEDIWHQTLGVNLMGAFFMARAAVPYLREAGSGVVVMTSSIASVTANGSSIAYCASKAGMNSLTKTLAKTLGSDGIRVNAVLPGLIDGDWAFNTWGGGDEGQYGDLKAHFTDQTPLGHVVTPDDVANTIVSFVTGSKYVTGQLLTLDGGFTL